VDEGDSGRGREGDVEGVAHLDAEESRRGDADDRERRAVERDSGSYRTWRPSESPLPERVADDGNRALASAAAPIVVWRERASEQRGNTQRGKELTARVKAVDRLNF